MGGAGLKVAFAGKPAPTGKSINRGQKKPAIHWPVFRCNGFTG
jgi:hypothetical protein